MAIEATLGIIGSGGGICWSVYRYGLKPILKKERDKKDEWIKKIGEIRDELKFNGGSSLKDVVYLVKESVVKIECRLDSIEENQKLSMNLQGIAYWISGDDGGCIYASPGLCKLFGRPEAQILGNNWTSWIHPEDKNHLVESWKFSTENQSAFDEIYRVKTSDGDYIKVWGVAFPAAKKNHFGGTLGKLVKIE